MARKNHHRRLAYTRDALIVDLCGWAHKVKVFDQDGNVVFLKEPPIWGRGAFQHGKDMEHKFKLQRIKDELANPRKASTPFRRARS